MRRIVQISIYRLVWACVASLLVGLGIAVTVFEVSNSRSVFPFPILGIAGLNVALIYIITSDIRGQARR